MDNNQPIIVKRVKKYAAGHHGGAWKIAFADFATAMMAFFLVLWLMSSATPEQKKAISGYFQDPIGFTESASPYVIDLGGTPTPAPDRTLNPELKDAPDAQEAAIDSTNQQVDAKQVETLADQIEKERLEMLLQELQNKVDENPELRKFKDQILFEITQDGLRIQIMDAANRPMFDLGSARLQPYFEDILLIMAETIKAVPNKISISGHRCQAVRRHRGFRQLGAFRRSRQCRASHPGGRRLPGRSGGAGGRLRLFGAVRSRGSLQSGEPPHRHHRADQEGAAGHRRLPWRPECACRRRCPASRTCQRHPAGSPVRPRAPRLRRPVAAPLQPRSCSRS